MIPVDTEYNTLVRQRFAANCLSLTNRIAALRARNAQISRKLISAIEKGKVLHGQWLVILNSH
jgi:hypothetical protein